MKENSGENKDPKWMPVKGGKSPNRMFPGENRVPKEGGRGEEAEVAEKMVNSTDSEFSCLE